MLIHDQQLDPVSECNNEPHPLVARRPASVLEDLFGSTSLYYRPHKQYFCDTLKEKSIFLLAFNTKVHLILNKLLPFAHPYDATLPTCRAFSDSVSVSKLDQSRKDQNCH